MVLQHRLNLKLGSLMSNLRQNTTCKTDSVKTCYLLLKFSLHCLVGLYKNFIKFYFALYPLLKAKNIVLRFSLSLALQTVQVLCADEAPQIL